MKLGVAFQRVQSMYSRGVQSQNTRLTKRHIYSAIMSGRATLLQQQYNKNQKISQWAYQVLPCVELVPAALHECACIPDKGCFILRTKYKIPQPITGIDRHLIQSVTSVDGISRTFSETTLTGHKYSKGNKFTAEQAQYYIHNGYLFITIDRMLKAISIVQAAGDILEMQWFPSLCPCTGCGCENIDDIEFPFDTDLETALFQLAYNELIGLLKQGKEDTKADAMDNTNAGMLHQNQDNG